MKTLLHKIINFFTHQDEWNKLNEEIKKYESLLGLKKRTGKELFYDPHFRDNPTVWRKYNLECRKRYLKDLKEKYKIGYKSPDIIGGTAIKIIEDCNNDMYKFYSISPPISGCYRENPTTIKIYIALIRKNSNIYVSEEYINDINTLDCISTWKECDNLEDYYIMDISNQTIKEILDYDNKKKISRT